jgi:hypothetical protein
MKRTLFLAIAMLFAVAAPASAQHVGSRYGVTIVTCVVNSNGSGLTNGINIVYFNKHDAAATEIDFLVRYGGHAFILIDRGTFTRGSQINHNLNNALTGQPWNGPNPTACQVNRVILSNGKVFPPRAQ